MQDQQMADTLPRELRHPDEDIGAVERVRALQCPTHSKNFQPRAKTVAIESKL